MPQNFTNDLITNQNQLLVVVTSLPNMEDAKALAHHLLGEKLAACVQLMGGMQSLYQWEGKVCDEQEVLLAAKTTQSKWAEISRFIQEKHSYDLPEILAFSPMQYARQYGEWVQAEVKSKP